MTKMWKMLLLVQVSAWERCVLMLLRIRSHICCPKPVPFALATHSPSERWHVLKLPSTGSLAGAQTKKLHFRVAPMFVTDGKPNMQYAELTEDLRDEGLEPWQPVVAH